MTKKHIRKLILLTLSQSEKGERRKVQPKEMEERIRKLFDCVCIVVAKERHQDGEKIHHHIAVLNENASKNQAIAKIREALEEWEGRQCDVSFHKTWKSLCAYITKQDKAPYVWGKFTINQVLAEAKAARDHKSTRKITPETGEDKNQRIYAKLRQCNDFLALRKDPELADLLLLKYQTIRNLWEDEQSIKAQLESPMGILVDFLQKRGWPKEYLPEDIKDKYFAIDWIAVN